MLALDDGYHEHPVDATLAATAECVWTFAPGRGARHSTFRVLPDGCVDVLVDLAAGTARLVGPMTRAIVVAQDRPHLAVRLRPGRAGRLLPLPVDALTDTVVPLAELFAEGEQLAERVAAATDFAVARRRLCAFFTLDAAGESTHHRLAAAAADALARPAATVESVARGLGVSRQHLTRVFRRHAGLSPVQWTRIARLQRGVALALDPAPYGERPSWAAIAARAGYADQSHLIAETKALCGVTPTGLIAERGE